MHDTGTTTPPPAPAARAISAVAAACGQIAAVCATLIVLLTAGLVLAYAFGEGSVKVQDLVLWLNAAMVMLGLGWALRERGHVRIDVLSARWTARTRARVELAGLALLLLPFCASVVWLSWDYVAMSWAVRERSASSGGLPGLYLAKTLLPLGAAQLLLLLQGLAEAARALGAAMEKPSP